MSWVCCLVSWTGSTCPVNLFMCSGRMLHVDLVDHDLLIVFLTSISILIFSAAHVLSVSMSTISSSVDVWLYAYSGHGRAVVIVRTTIRIYTRDDTVCFMLVSI